MSTPLTFAVDTMSCEACVRHIGQALTEQLGGRATHQIDLPGKRVTVAGEVQEAEVVQALADAGYPSRRV